MSIANDDRVGLIAIVRDGNLELLQLSRDTRSRQRFAVTLDLEQVGAGFVPGVASWFGFATDYRMEACGRVGVSANYLIQQLISNPWIAHPGHHQWESVDFSPAYSVSRIGLQAAVMLSAT